MLRSRMVLLVLVHGVGVVPFDIVRPPATIPAPPAAGDGNRDQRPARGVARPVRPRLFPRPQRPGVHGVARGRVHRRSQPALRLHARLAVVVRHAHPAAAVRTAVHQAAGLERARLAAGRGADAGGAARHGSAGHRDRPAAPRGAGAGVDAAARRRPPRARRHARRLLRHLPGRPADAVQAPRRRRVVQPGARVVGADAHRRRPRQPRHRRRAADARPGRQLPVQPRHRQVAGGLRPPRSRRDDGADAGRRLEHPDRRQGGDRRPGRRDPRGGRPRRPRRAA